MNEFEKIITETENQIANKENFAGVVIVIWIKTNCLIQDALMSALTFLNSQNQRSKTEVPKRKHRKKRKKK